MSLSVTLPSPSRIIPRIQLSPRVRQKVIDFKKSPKRYYRKQLKSPNKRTKSYLMNQRQFHAHPHVNPETNRKIKVHGKTYKRLVDIYGMP